MPDELKVIFNACKVWFASCELKCEDAKGPNVHLFWVDNAFPDLWCHEVLRSYHRLPISHALREEVGRAQVRHFDIARSTTKNIGCLDVSMQEILIVHLLQALRNLVNAVATKIFWVIFLVIRDYFPQRTLIHVLKNKENLIFIIVQIKDGDHFIAVQVRIPVCLTYDQILELLCSVSSLGLNALPGKLLLIANSF